MRQRDSALARLILVDVLWSEWNSKTDRKKYLEIIKELLMPPLPEAADVGSAYLHMCYEKDPEPWVVQQAPYELPPRDDCLNPELWHEGQDKQSQAVAPLYTGSAPEPEAGKIQVHGVAEWGKFFRARIFMHATRYRAAVSCKGDADYWALIDMRFQRVSESLVLWHTGLSLWSGLPWNAHHRPAGLQSEDSQAMSSTDADRLTLDFHEHSREGFRDYLRRKKVAPMELRVFDRLYEPPFFLVAVPARQANDGLSQHRVGIGSDDLSNQSDILRNMSRAVLWSRRYESHPCALLKGGVNVYRRFFAVAKNDRPRYLLIPDTEAWAPDIHAWHSVQEEATAIDVGILTNLEAYAASQLRGIDTRMQILENHLKIYLGVAEQAGTLWDALARLLPDARGSFLRSSVLEDVHSSIEMIHQTLLQGVADLDQLARNIDVALSQIETTADEVADRFDRELHHLSPEKGAALRDSLRSGYIDRLRRRVREDATAAARVTESYRTLLDTIGLAFDERRVREGDRIQRASVWLAAGFGVLGVSGIAQATAPVPTLSYPWAWGLKALLWLVSVIVLLWVWWLIRNLRSVGQVATQEFEMQYKYVRGFLANASTDYLDRFQPKQPTGPKDWTELDKQLCEKFIKAWEAPSKYLNETEGKNASKSDTGADSYDAQPLRRRVEKWSLETLLLTERPRDFSLYPLPYLTCLYRLCTAKQLKAWVAIPELPNAYSAVGDAELQRVLSYISKYNWFRQEEDQLRHKTPKEIYECLRKHFQQGDAAQEDAKPQAKPEYQLSTKP